MKLLITVLLGFLSQCALASELAPTRIGYAYDKDGETLLYTEHHHEAMGGGLVSKSRVLYKTADGDIFAEKDLDFGAGPFLPEFSLRNTRTGHIETTRYVEDSYNVRFVESRDDRAKEKDLNFSNDAISDAGFDNFISSYWDEITSGSSYTKDFLIPGLFRFFKFKIYQDDIVEEDNEKYRVIHIEPANFLLRTLAGTSKLYYAYDWPELKKFHGVSNMRDDNGDNYRVTIHYEKVSYSLSANDETL